MRTCLMSVTNASIFRRTQGLSRSRGRITYSYSYFQRSVLRRYTPSHVLNVYMMVSTVVSTSDGRMCSAALGLPSVRDARVVGSLGATFPKCPMSLLGSATYCSCTRGICKGVGRGGFTFLGFNHNVNTALFARKDVLKATDKSFARFNRCSVSPRNPRYVYKGRKYLRIVVSRRTLGGEVPRFKRVPSLDTLSRVAFSSLKGTTAFHSPATLTVMGRVT